MLVNVTIMIVRTVVFILALNKPYSPEANKRIRNIRVYTTCFYLAMFVVFAIMAGGIPTNIWDIIIEVFFTALINHFSIQAEKNNGDYVAA